MSGQMKEHPRYNVVSMRVSDEEYAELQRAARKGKSISRVVRDRCFGEESILCQRNAE